ncbi:MAG: ABC transporter permease [Betaproteobacteria bacterium]|nr:ABC transporter permease [Betaproteobacteria bacterium]
MRLSLAVRNLIRQRSRTATSLGAIIFGVASMIIVGGFVNDIFIQLGEATIHSQTGHIQLAKSGFWAARSRASDSFMIQSTEKLKLTIGALLETDQVVSRVNFVGMLNNGKRDLGIFGDGIEPDGEAHIGSFMRYIQGRPLADKDTDGMVIGQGVAQSLNLKVGDHATLVISLAQGAVNTLDFKVIGIFQSFSREFDARAVRIPLPAAQDLLDTRSVHLVITTLKLTNDSERIANMLKKALNDEGLDIMTWRELSDFYEKTVQLYEAQFGVLRLIIFLMVLLSVANSINMSLFERTREFGTLLALGETPNGVFKLILTETTLLGAFGAFLGILTGVGVAWVISLVGIEMPPPPNSNLGYSALIRLDPIAILTSGAIGFFATVFASLYPARRSTKINIIDALRHGV